VDVYSWLQKCTVRSTGNIRSLAVGALDSSTVYAGVADGVTGLPTLATQFSSAATIQSLTVRGVPATAMPNSFTNSVIAGSTLASVAVTNVQTDNSANNHAAFGVAARTIQSLTWKQGMASYRWPATWPVGAGDFTVRVVP
jgi:hypothetical protein